MFYICFLYVIYICFIYVLYMIYMFFHTCFKCFRYVFTHQIHTKYTLNTHIFYIILYYFLYIITTIYPYRCSLINCLYRITTKDRVDLRFASTSRRASAGIKDAFDLVTILQIHNRPASGRGAKTIGINSTFDHMENYIELYIKNMKFYQLENAHISSFLGVLRPLVRLKTLLGIISIIWQSMGSWGAILIDSMNDNFFNIKF